MQFNKKHLKSYGYLAAGIIFLLLAAVFLAGGMGRNPLYTLQLLTGRIAIFFLLACLSITPLRTITGWIAVSPLRMAFGLNAFFFALAHVLVMIALEYPLNFNQFIQTLEYRRYIVPGALAFIILLVLAITSLNRVKKFTRTIWKKIHKFVYLAAVLALLHYMWIANAGGIKVIPTLSAIYLVVLFILRVNVIKKAIITRRLKKTNA